MRCSKLGVRCRGMSTVEFGTAASSPTMALGCRGPGLSSAGPWPLTERKGLTPTPTGQGTHPEAVKLTDTQALAPRY